MSWWSIATTEPKRKDKFYVSMGTGGILYSVSAVSKPSVTIETKEYRLVNHFYKYPGIPKWEPITVKFVDAKIWGSDKSILSGKEESAKAVSTSKTLWQMLLASGYITPIGTTTAASKTKIVAPEKSSMIDLSFGSSTKNTDGGQFRIHQVNAEGKKTETWTLYNPMFTKISWGDLDYNSNDLVEYTLDVAYDWAELTEE